MHSLPLLILRYSAEEASPFDNRIQYNLIISGPNFVSSFAYQDYVFFFYRETAVEYMNCGKVKL